MSRNKRSSEKMFSLGRCVCVYTFSICVLATNMYVLFFSLSIFVTKVFNRLVQEINKDAGWNHWAVLYFVWNTGCASLWSYAFYSVFWTHHQNFNIVFYTVYILMCVSAYFTSSGKMEREREIGWERPSKKIEMLEVSPACASVSAIIIAIAFLRVCCVQILKYK